MRPRTSSNMTPSPTCIAGSMLDLRARPCSAGSRSRRAARKRLKEFAHLGGTAEANDPAVETRKLGAQPPSRREWKCGRVGEKFEVELLGAAFGHVGSN